MLCWFLPNINMNQRRCTHVPFLLNLPPTSHPIPHSGLSLSTRLSWEGEGGKNWESGIEIHTLLLLSHFVMSHSVRPHRRQPTRLPRPWDSPGKNTGVGCRFLLQCRKGKVKPLSRVQPSATPWTAAFQAPPSMGFSRQEHWCGVPLPYITTCKTDSWGEVAV